MQLLFQLTYLSNFTTMFKSIFDICLCNLGDLIHYTITFVMTLFSDGKSVCLPITTRGCNSSCILIALVGQLSIVLAPSYYFMTGMEECSGIGG